MRTYFYCFLLVFSFWGKNIFAQNVKIQGYTYAANGSGYQGEVLIYVAIGGIEATEHTAVSDAGGQYNLEVPLGADVTLIARKRGWNDFRVNISTWEEKAGAVVFVKMPMERLPGYILEASLAEMLVAQPDAEPGADSTKREPEANSIAGALIEIYNNTTHQPELRLENHPLHTFSFRLEQGNEYTLLIRKEGYYNKRMKVFVNIKGCILCFEGFGAVTPQVVDNLTKSNTQGVLGANITMRKIVLGEGIKLDNIYYDLNKSDIRADAKPALDNLVKILRENPQIVVELRSHTDCRNTAKYNDTLSQRRAESAVAYITSKKIALNRIRAKGFGENAPVNKCKDGVDCSEELHQQNRRTEFAVVGYLPDPLEGRSLRSIIAEEELEDILKDLEGTYFEADSNAVGAVPAPQTPSVVPPVLPELPAVPPLPAQAQDSVVALSVPPPPVEANEEKPDNPVAQVVIDSPRAAAPAQTPADQAIVLRRPPKSIPPTYTGFMVELVVTEGNLPPDHAIFAEFGSLYVDATVDGKTAYMVGSFGKFSQATDYRQNALGSRFPGARIVKYDQGVRVEARR